LSLPDSGRRSHRRGRRRFPRNVTVLHLDTRLSTWPLRLDRTPSHIEQELQALAAHIVERAAAAQISTPASSS
jgi:hypothetical protein